MTKPYNILISEDEKLNFILLKKLLHRLVGNDISISHAENGRQAIDICDDSIDLVLMDIEMPIMNGLEASEILKEKYPKIPIIIQTAHCSTSNQERAEKIGCNGFLAKPIVKKEFESIINQHLLDIA